MAGRSCHNGHPLWLYPLSVLQSVALQKQDKENRWAWVYLGVELLFHSLVWSFQVFCFCLSLFILDSNEDTAIAFLFIWVASSSWFCVWRSVGVCVVRTHILILSAKQPRPLLLIFSPFFFSPTLLFLSAQLVSIVEQAFAWHRQTLTVSGPWPGPCHTLYSI